MAEAVRLENVTFGYGSGVILRDISLSVLCGQFVTLCGPSGCGKTTLLKLLGGYLAPSSGGIFFGSQEVTHSPAERRGVGMVFQNYALFPHLSARRNIAFGLEVRGLPRVEVRQRVEAILGRVGLTPEEADRKPANLSGGQQQRVALARAMVIEPQVLLLDEPFANLDRRLRENLRGELRQLQREIGLTTILVTHDQEEALSLSDTVAVMNAGAIQQVGSPGAVYHRPQNRFVAEFLGDANLLDASDFGNKDGGQIMIRPEVLIIGADAESCKYRWHAEVLTVSFLGSGIALLVRCENGLKLRIRTTSTQQIAVGDRVRVGLPEVALWTIPG